MNCTVIQRRLLSAEQPDRPAADLRGHLAECPACRAWHRRLVHLERHIPLLPVPPSAGKAELVNHLLGTPPAAAPPPTLRWAVAGPKERGLRKLSLAFAMAAALLLFALGWWAWPHHTSSVAPPGPARDLDRERIEGALAASKTPRERVERLTDLAEQVHGEALGLAHDAEQLDRKARLYAEVVRGYLPAHARALAPEERRDVLPAIANRLSKMESRATRQALQSDPGSARAFRRIALAAAGGERSLRALAAPA